jgi:hypothetical protein
MDGMLHCLSGLTDKLQQLEREVKDLERHFAEQSQATLLGQVAHLLDRAASEYVRMSRRTASIDHISLASRFHELPVEQEQRWQTFKQALQQLGWSDRDVVSVSSWLRTGRFGTAAEIDNVTAADLMQWAERAVKGWRM